MKKILAWVVAGACLTLIGWAGIYVIRFLFWAWQFVVLVLASIAGVIILSMLWDLVCWSFKTVWGSFK